MKTKRNYKIYVLFLLIIALLIGLSSRPIFSNNSNVSASSSSRNNFYFSLYKVDVKVNLDNSFQITESVTVNYEQADMNNRATWRKGWVRAIPLVTNVTRLWQTTNEKVTTKYNYTLTDVEDKTLNMYNHYIMDDYYYIEFGGDDYINLESGVSIDYVYSYTLNLGYDMYPKADEFYFNLYGTDNPVRAEKFVFNITMPKEFDASNINFYVGEYGESSTPVSIRYDVINNTISNLQALEDYEAGVVDHGVFGLAQYQGLTVRLELPEGYFSEVDSSKFSKNYDVFVLVVTIICFVAVLVICMMKAGKNKPVITVEFYPPDGVTPPEATYITRASLLPKHMTSLLLSWASKKCIKINLDEKNEPVSLTKIAELPDSAKPYEKDIFEKMFASSQTYNLDDKDYKLNIAFNDACSFISNTEGQRYSGKSIALMFFTGFLALIPLFSLLVLAFVIRQPLEIDALVEFILLFVMQLVFVVCIVHFKKNVFSKFVKCLLVLLQVILALGFCLLTIKKVPAYLDLFSLRFFVFLPFLLFYVFGADIFSTGNSLLQFTESMKLKYGKLMGLKNNIQLVDYNKIKIFVSKDPEYFYDVLPYAYALGVLDDFVKKFEGLAIPLNTCYGSLDVLTIHIVCDSMNRKIVNNMISTIKSGGHTFGGGSIGGGFSGGGVGGGGSFGR